MADIASANPLVPSDDLTRARGFAQADGTAAPHIGLVGATYTIMVSGKDTGGRFCVIDSAFRREAGRLHIVTHSKRPSSCSR